MKTIKNNLKVLSTILGLSAMICTTSCSSDDDAPAPEDDLEVITDVNLVFTNTNDPTDIVRASAEDEDGLGSNPLTVTGPIELTANTTYTLTYEILNGLEDPTDPEDVAEEILEEDNDHQFFYAFSEGAFTNPAGNGNVDTASDPIVYNDEDENGNPVGLSTTWTTAGALNGGTFNVRLQHQPGIKTATSTAQDGDSDFDLTFVLSIAE